MKKWQNTFLETRNSGTAKKDGQTKSDWISVTVSEC